MVDVPIYSDIRSFDGKEYKDADIVVGGFPCQPWSVHGSSKREEDDRDLWHERWRGLLKTYYHDGSLAKMCQALLQCQWVSEEVSLTWKVSDTKPSHILFQMAAVDAKHDEYDLWIVLLEHDGSSATTFRGGNNQLMEGQRKGQ